MSSFEYTALNADGNRISGMVQADAMDEAVKMLQQDFDTVIAVKPAAKAPERTQSGFSRRFEEWRKRQFHRVPMRSVVFFTRQLSTMFSAGMTVERALRNLCRTEKNPRFKGMLGRISDEINAGKSLSDSLSRHPGAFSRLYIALVQAGEMSGTLGEVLDKLADYLERTEDVRRKVTSALYYPAFVLGVLAVSVYLLVVVVAPRFSRIYASFGAQLPLPTQILMSVSSFLVDNIIYGVMGAILFAGATLFWSMTDRGREILDLIKLKAPIVGKLMRDSIMARFSRTLGLLMASSVPVLDAFTLVSRVVHNTIVEKAVLQSRDLVQQGRGISASLAAAKTFPDIVVQLVATGEETGELDTLFIKCGEYYEKEVDSLIGRITALIEPFLIVLLGVVVGALVIIIYLPIFFLGTAMKQGLG
jgi:type IV pilus assembly protein PilC